MRCMERNKVEFWYAPYAGHTHMVDEYGNELNEIELSFERIAVAEHVLDAEPVVLALPELLSHKNTP